MRVLLKPATTLFRCLTGGAVKMSDLAAGKKAAAVKAIDDYVKVYNLTLLQVFMLCFPLFACRIIRTWEWGVAAPLYSL